MLMSKATDLHLYLKQRPGETVLFALLDLYGFSMGREVDKSKTEPKTTYFKWNLPGVSSAGFQLLFFDTLFPDDLNLDSYESFIIMSGYSDSSVADFSMLDTMAVLLLNRYGGRLHNPQRIEKISTSYLLSGSHFSPDLVESL